MYLIKKSTIFDKNIKSEIWKHNFLGKRKFWQKSQIWWKCQIWGKNQIWETFQIWEKCQFLMYPPPPPPPPILWMWYLIFFWTKKKFWQTKREQTLPWNSNSSDLDAELATSAASRWKHFMWRHQYPLVYPIPSQHSRWLIDFDNFLQFWPNLIILTKNYNFQHNHISNQIH